MSMQMSPYGGSQARIDSSEHERERLVARMKLYRKYGCVVAIMLASAGCTTMNYQRKSAGHVGCLPDDVDVPDAPDFAILPASWTAICRGKRFICTESIVVTGVYGNGTIVNCSAVPLQ